MEYSAKIRLSDTASAGGFPIEELPFTDRDAEIRSLSGLFAEVTSSRHSKMVLVLGEAGIGKTRFFLEFRKFIESPNFYCLSAKCSRADDLAPYSPWIQLLREFVNRASVKIFFKVCGTDLEQIVRLVPELSENTDTTRPSQSNAPMSTEEEVRQRFLFFQSLTNFFSRLASESPVVMFFDDLQWADTATVQLLSYFEKYVLRNHPILLVLACREFEAITDQNPSVANLIKDMQDDNLCSIIRLDRFDDVRVQQLLASASKRNDVSREFAGLIHSKTGGNPLFIKEVLRSLFERNDIFTNEKGQWDRKPISEIEIPSTIVDVITKRLDRLDFQTRELLRLASVIGETFDTEVLRRLSSEVDAEGRLSHILEIGEKSGLLEKKIAGSTSRAERLYGFSDESIHDVLYSELADSKLKDLHLKLGLILEEANPGSLTNDVFSELAYHFGRAGAETKAFEYNLKAGDRASAVYAHEEAAIHYNNALVLLRNNSTLGEEPVKATILSKLGEETYRFMGGDSGSDYLEEAATIFEKLGEKKIAAGLLTRLTEIYLLAGHDKEKTLAMADKVVNLLANEPPSLELLYALGMGYVLLNLWAGERQKAAEWMEKAELLSKHIGDPKIDAIFASAAVELRPITEKVHVSQRVEKALEYLSETGDIRQIIYAQFHHAVSKNNTKGPSESSLKILIDAEEYAEKMGYFDLVFYYKGLICEDYIALGQWGNANRVVDELLESLRKFPKNPTLYFMTNLFMGRSLLLSGKLDKSEECLKIASEGKLLSPLFAQTALVDLCRLYIQRGDFAKASGFLDEAFRVSKSKGLTMFTSLRHADLVSLMTDVDVMKHSSLQEAQSHIKEMQDTAEKVDEDWTYAYLYRSQGVLASNQLDFQSALECLDKSVQIWQKNGWTYELARAIYEMAVAHYKSNNTTEAERIVTESLELFRKLGARVEMEKCEALNHDIQLMGATPAFADVKTRTIFSYLCESFVQDNAVKNLNPESSGWRTLAELANNSGIAVSSLYGRVGGKIGANPMIKELLSSGYVEMKTFPGERGRGGEVTRFRIKHEVNAVRNYANLLAKMKSEVLR